MVEAMSWEELIEGMLKNQQSTNDHIAKLWDAVGINSGTLGKLNEAIGHLMEAITALQQERPAEPIHVIVAIDKDANEALYVGGDLVEICGNTVYAHDIATVSGNSVIQFSHVEVKHDLSETSPERFEELFFAK